jgi:hypothetical protein
MAVDGIKLTVPADGGDQVYEGTGNIQLEIEQSRNWLLSGGGTVIGFASGLFDGLGSSSTIRTPLASGHLGAAGGSHVFEFRFDQWEGSSDSWGPSSSGETPIQKMLTLDMELARAEVDSLNPATLETSILSSDTQAGTGDAIDDRYDSMPVVVQQSTPSIDFEETGGSLTRASLTLVETIDLSAVIDDVVGGSGVTPEFKITSTASGATDDLPVSADTLMNTGAQTQGAETDESRLAQKNDAATQAANPTTRKTSQTARGTMLRGAFRGANASTLADKLLTQYLSNDNIDENNPVSLETEGATGTNPITGDYLINGQRSMIEPLVPAVTSDAGVYGYQLDLQEV